MAASSRGGGPSRGRRSGAAGRTPRPSKAGAGRSGVSTVRRSRAALPGRAPVSAAVARRRRTTLTARAAVLAVALASVALAIALPFKIWLAQRGEISSLQSQTRAQQQHVAALQRQQQQWQDPAYVEQQARLRLHYVKPGEKAYIVLGRPKPKTAQSGSSSSTPSVTGPWYSRLWQTVQDAGASSK